MCQMWNSLSLGAQDFYCDERGEKSLSHSFSNDHFGEIIICSSSN